jgi:carboxylate-amine ligase
VKAFKKNTFPTLGVEEEFHLIDPATADLAPRVNDVMSLLEGSLREQVCHELLLCVLENRTGVYHTVDDLINAIGEGRTQLAAYCKKCGVDLVASGSHPFGQWRNMPYVDNDHYHWVRTTCGYIAHRLLAFGLHIHVGIQNEAAALYIMNEMRRWTYPLMALSANSPYYEGLQTGLMSTRTHLFQSMPRTGFAPLFKHFNELEEYYDKLIATKDITRPGDLWWCIRPQPPLGTVEYRFFDLPTSVRRIGAFAALVQAATATYQDAFFAGKPASTFHPGYLEQNRWRAMKDGIRGDIVEPETGEILSLATQLRRLVEFTHPKAVELKTEDHLTYALTMVEAGSEAELQIELCKKFNGDFRSLERELAKETLIFSSAPM